MTFRRAALEIIALSLLVGAFACDGSGGLATLPTRLAAARCAGYSHCWDNNQPTYQTLWCEDSHRHWARNLVYQWTLGAEKGTLVLDDALMELCLDRLAAGHVCRTEGPEKFMRDDPACQAAVRGLVDDGGPCLHHSECGVGSYCGEEPTCGGTCTPYAGETDYCSWPTTLCEADLVCPLLGNSCIRPRDEGEACSYPGMPCRPDLRCYGADADAGIDGACGPKNGSANVGDPCERASDCVDGLVCGETDDLGGGSVCLTRVGPGEPCFRSMPQSCAGGHYCVIDDGSAWGMCEPLLDDTEPCGVDVFNACRPGSHCTRIDLAIATSDSFCRPLRLLGESCMFNGTPCAQGTCLDLTVSEGTCELECM